MPTKITPSNPPLTQHGLGTPGQTPPPQGDTFAGRTVSTPPNGTRLPVPPDPRRDLKPRVLTQDAPAWKPQGSYAPADKGALMPKMFAYANFLHDHPEQIPQDIRSGVEADLRGGKSLFLSLMPRLIKKHFSGVPAEKAPQESSKTQESEKAKSTQPAWVPQGEYTQTEHKQLLPQMHAYAQFLSDNPSQVPPDVKAALQKSENPKMDTIRVLLVKHFPHTRALLLKLAAPSIGDAMKQMVLEQALNKSKNPPIDTPPLDTPPEEKPKPLRFGINLAATTKAEKGAWSETWTPDAQPPGTKFYHEKQSLSSGLCGMHSINAFAGAPVTSPGDFQSSIYAQLMAGGIVDEATARDIAKDGSDPSVLATMMKGLSARGIIDPAAQHALTESMNFSNEKVRQAFCAKINQFKGDRVIVGYGGGHEGESHFVALRRDADQNWVLINSLKPGQEPIKDLGAYVTEGRAHAHFIQMEKGFTVEDTPPEPEKPAGQGVA